MFIVLTAVRCYITLHYRYLQWLGLRSFKLHTGLGLYRTVSVYAYHSAVLVSDEHWIQRVAASAVAST